MSTYRRRPTTKKKPYKKTVRRAKRKANPQTKRKEVAWKKVTGGILPASLAAIGTLAGGTVGTAYPGIGTYVGGTIGGAIGGAAGHAINYFTGLGDYEIKANSLLVGAQNNSIQNNINNELGGTVFNKTEYIGDVLSSANAGAFKLTTWEFNPGNPDLFSWLSQCSSNWQQYICEGAYIEYRPFSGNALNSTNTSLGCVTLSGQYNCNDPDFESKQEMEGADFTISVVPSEGVRYFIECERGRNVLDNLYIRGKKNTVISNDRPVPIDDKRFENLLKFSCATSGCQGTNVNLGSLYITYQIRLLKTKLYDTIGMSNSIFRCANTDYLTVNAPFGRYIPVYNNIGLKFWNSGTLNGVEFPYNSQVQEFLVVLKWMAADNASISIVGVVKASPNAIKSITPVGYMSAPEQLNSTNEVVRAYYVRTAGNGEPLRIYTDSADSPILPTGAGQLMYMEIIQTPNDFS